LISSIERTDAKIGIVEKIKNWALAEAIKNETAGVINN